MAWSTPKTDWTTDNVIATTDLIRIETNISHVNGSASNINGMSTIASTANLPVTKKMHVVSGNNEIKFLQSDGFVSGATIFLYFSDATAITMHHLELSPPTNYAQIYTMAGADLTLSMKDVLICNYDGTYWNVIECRIG